MQSAIISFIDSMPKEKHLAASTSPEFDLRIKHKSRFIVVLSIFILRKGINFCRWKLSDFFYQISRHSIKISQCHITFAATGETY